MTIADSEYELIVNLTDAILTYFEVPRTEASQTEIVYFPKVSPHGQPEKLKAKYFYLLASQNQHGGDTGVRTT